MRIFIDQGQRLQSCSEHLDDDNNNNNKPLDTKKDRPLHCKRDTDIKNKRERKIEKKQVKKEKKKIEKDHLSDCGTVGRAVASNSRGPGFESGLWQFYQLSFTAKKI